MPRHVVDRINASLAAEQAERSAHTSESTGAPVIPLLSRVRGRRPARVLFATAGAAAAVALIAVVGSTLSTVSQPTSTDVAAATPSKAAPEVAAKDSQGFSGRSSPTSPPGAGAPAAAAPATGTLRSAPAAQKLAASAQLRRSEVKYTRAGFVTQARRLQQAQPARGVPEGLTSGNTTSREPPLKAARAEVVAGLPNCLQAIGADRAQVVLADVSTYEGRPAMIILATTDKTTIAYAVGLQCGHNGGAFLLHAGVAIRLP